MVKHWFKLKSQGWQIKAFLNGLGALATFVVFLDIVAEKFLDGAWFIIVLISIMFFIFNKISGHYRELAKSLELSPNDFTPQSIKNDVIVLVQAVHAGTVNTVRYAETISAVCQAVYVEIDPDATTDFKEKWQKIFPHIELVILPSPYRSLLHPILTYIDSLEREHPDHTITVIIGEFVPTRWWHSLLHGNTGLMLKLALLSRPDVIVTNVRYDVRPKSMNQIPEKI
jgi:hypothetical protein